MKHNEGFFAKLYPDNNVDFYIEMQQAQTIDISDLSHFLLPKTDISLRQYICDTQEPTYQSYSEHDFKPKLKAMIQKIIDFYWKIQVPLVQKLGQESISQIVKQF